jgi:hypothetical protein
MDIDEFARNRQIIQFVIQLVGMLTSLVLFGQQAAYFSPQRAGFGVAWSVVMVISSNS